MRSAPGMNIGLLKTSLVNFPGRVAATVFLPGCNLRCPFCHNAELACASVVSGPHVPEPGDETYVSLQEAYAHLEKRARVLGGLAISGGEPLLSPALPELVAKARALGLAVKIDTNGTLPDRLLSILDDPRMRPDMIAIDVKTSPSRYGELATEPHAGDALGAALGATLCRSLEIIELDRANSRFPDGTAKSALKVEYRTVLVPGLVGEADIRAIGALLPADADWELAAFAPGVCLDPAWNDIAPYGPEETKRLAAIAQTLIPGAKIR